MLGPNKAMPRGVPTQSARSGWVEKSLNTLEAALVYRPMLVVGVFVALTIALIIQEPKREPTPFAGPATDTMTLPVPAEETAPVEQITAVEADPLELEAPVEAAPEIAVTRAATAPLVIVPAPIDPVELAKIRPVARPGVAASLETDAQATPPVPANRMLFKDLAEARPTLLTTTVLTSDGVLVPSMLAVKTSGEAQDTTTDGPLDIRNITPMIATTTPSALGDAALRTRLAAAPTRAMHTVRLGDSPLTLALRYFGEADKANLILEANRRHLGSDGQLVIGQILRIPDLNNL